MEQPQQQQQQQPSEDGGSGKGGFLCRQSSTRWTPTSDQIRILKDLYYNNGVRSPNADQIQRISARLRQYGKIEGKNVFYWFQNHKARERQKKRFTTTTATNSDNIMPMQKPLGSCCNASNNAWKHPEDYSSSSHQKLSHISPAGVSSSSSSAGVFAVGQMGSYGYGSVTMEKSFRDCSISASGSSHNFGWIGMDHCASPYALVDSRKSAAELEDHEDHEAAPAIETLPLFPMREDINGFCNFKPDPDGFYSGWYRSEDGGGSRTSLELSLSSYHGRSPDEC